MSEVVLNLYCGFLDGCRIRFGAGDWYWYNGNYFHFGFSAYEVSGREIQKFLDEYGVIR